MVNKMDDILIKTLSAEEQQALVCMYFAKLPSSDPRYKKMKEYFSVLELTFEKKYNTYRHRKDEYDYFFGTNERKGWENKSVEKFGEAYRSVYYKYKDYDISLLEKAVEKIMALYDENYDKNYDNLVSLKCIQPDVAHAVLRHDSVITVSDIYTLAEKLTLNNTILLTLGGDTGNSEVDWKPGFRGVAHIIKAPYGHGYRSEKKYFKIDIKVDVILPDAMTRNDFLKYKSAWNVTFIGPELKRDPTQAVASITYDDAVAVVRCALDRFPEIKDDLERTFSKSFMDKVYGPTEKLLSVMVKHGETDEAALRRELNSPFQDSQSQNGDHINFSSNILLYGVPGCGKSHYVEQKYESQITNDQSKVRVVFHPDYTNSDFVGQIMPVLKTKDKDNGEKEEKLEYDFVPGPFTRILKTAETNPTEKCLLIIEELNRGNAPAIFGEVFQLLDRDDDGTSKYAIYNRDIAEKVYDDEKHPIRIPSNLTIIATMNTSDQNVFTMDTAFQRRWQMKHIPNKFEGKDLNEETRKHVAKLVPGSSISWGVFATTVNSKMGKASLGFAGTEDKSLGVYFATDKDLDSKDIFAEKVIKYLWDDAFKMGRSELFKEPERSLSYILETFDETEGDALKAVLLDSVYQEMKEKMLAAEELEPVEEAESVDAEPAEEE